MPIFKPYVSIKIWHRIHHYHFSHFVLENSINSAFRLHANRNNRVPRTFRCWVNNHWRLSRSSSLASRDARPVCRWDGLLHSWRLADETNPLLRMDTGSISGWETFVRLFAIPSWCRQSRRHGRHLVGLVPPNKAPSPQNETWNIIYEWVLVNFTMSSPPAQTKSPPIENFLATVLGVGAQCRPIQFYQSNGRIE